MEHSRAICSLILLLSVVFVCGEAAGRGRHRGRRARHERSALPSPLTPPAAVAEQEEDLQREYDQARQADAAQQSSAPAAAPSSEIHAALRDLEDATTIKGQFNEFLARVSDDTSKLQEEVRQKETQVADLEAKASDMKLRVKAAEAENAATTKRIQHALQVRKGKYETQLKVLESQNSILTKTNLKLIGTNDDLNKALEEEKARNERLVAKLQNMATTFTEQQNAVQQMVSESAQKVAKEAEDEARAAQDAAVDEEAASANVIIPAEKPLARRAVEIRQARPGTAAVAAKVDDTAEQEVEAHDEDDDGAPEMQELDSEVDEDVKLDTFPLVPPAPPKTASKQNLKPASTRSRRAPAGRSKKTQHALAGSTRQGSKPALPPLPVAPPKSSDEQIERLRKEVDALSKHKVEPVASATMGAIQKEQHKEAAPGDAGLAALQDVGNMLNDVDGM